MRKWIMKNLKHQRTKKLLYELYFIADTKENVLNTNEKLPCFMVISDYKHKCFQITFNALFSHLGS